MAGVKIKAEVKGLRELDFALRAMLPTIERERVIVRALHDGARPITAEARRRAPVLNLPLSKLRVVSRKAVRGRSTPYYGTTTRVRGALKSGITQHTDRHHYSTVMIRVRNRGYIFAPSARSADAAKAGNPNYWWLVEFGTSKAKAQPFLYPAFETKKNEALRNIQLSLLRGVFAVGKSLGFDVRDWAEAA